LIGSGTETAIGQRARTLMVVALASLILVAGAGCAASTAGQESSWRDEAILRLQTPASVWWTGSGEYAVVQAVGKDGRLVATAWNRATGDVLTYPGYRVVGVEPHAPRFWVVPDSRVVPSGSHEGAVPHVIDIAGDGVDSPPEELYTVRLDQDAKPRSDVDARWHSWGGSAAYSVSVEIDVNKGACPSTLRFSETGSSRNAWSAKVPTDVVTFEPIGWSPSGLYFAVISAADASATAETVAASVAAWEKAAKDADTLARAKGDQPVDVVTPPPPTWGADILVFSAADGSLARRQKVRVPVLEQNAGANLAAWVADDVLLYIEQSNGRPVVGGLKPLAKIEMSGDLLSKPDGQPLRYAWIAGVDEAGPVFALMADGGGLEGDIRAWRVGDGPATGVDLGPVAGSVAARWSPQGGMLSLAGPMSEPAWNVYLAKPMGAEPVRIMSVGGR
jgi:hypothetical protein